MAISPRVVTEDRHITWDGVIQRLPKGQVLDVPPDSALEREIGRDFLVPLPGFAAEQVPAREIAPKASPRIGDGLNEVIGKLSAAGALADEPAPARPRAKSGDGKDGDS
jgi:hypothetical protein